MHGKNPRKRHGVPIPNNHEKEDARKVIADGQREAQRVARMESALHAAAGRIESFRRIMFLLIDQAPGKEIRVSQAEIERVFKDAATAKTAVFEVDADSEPGTIIYRIPSPETLSEAERVASIMEHSEASAPPDLDGFSAEDRADIEAGNFVRDEDKAPPAAEPPALPSGE